MRLIDADALRKEFEEWPDYDDILIIDLKEMIDSAPTIDAVPVVRCKDCKYMNTEVVNSKPYYECSLWEYFETPLNGYCHKAERREDETD